MSKKIAVFDSGLGGLTVLSSLEVALPYEDFVYHGDSAHAPYGTRSDTELLKLNTVTIKKLLSDYDIKCFVCACNTTTSRIWDELCVRFSGYSFVGICPAVDWAVAENPGKNVLLMGTNATISSKKIKDRVLRLKQRANVKLLAAQDIVWAVENGTTKTQSFKDYLKALLLPFAEETDAIVLGCTHFPFVKSQIASFMKKSIKFYDASVVTAAETKKLLETNDLLNRETKTGSIIFLNSDPNKISIEESLLREYGRK